jgi:predicted DNA-binding ribbon-helix-helix protein
MALSDLVSSIDSERKHGNLSSALRLFVLDHYRSQVTGGGALDKAPDGFSQPREAMIA